MHAFKQQVIIVFRQHRLLLAIAFLATLSPVVTDLYIAAMPDMIISLHTSASNIERTVQFFIVGVTAVALIAGPVSDHIGRRRTILAGLVLALLGTWVCALSETITVLWLGRILQGLGCGASVGLVRSLVRDHYSGQDLIRVGSIVGMFVALSPMVAPMIGAMMIEHGHWHTCFMWMAGYMVGVAWLFWLVVQDPADEAHDSNKLVANPSRPGLKVAARCQILWNDYRSVLQDHHLLFYALLSGMGLSCILTQVTLSSLVFEGFYHVSHIHYGYLTMGLSVALIVGRWWIQRLTRHHSIHQVLTLMAGLMLLAALVSMGTLHLPSPWVVPSLTGATDIFLLAAFCLSPLTFALAFEHHKQHAGTASALYSLLQNSVALLVMQIISRFAHVTPTLMVNTFLGLALLACALCALEKAWVVHRQKLEETFRSAAAGVAKVA